MYWTRSVFKCHHKPTFPFHHWRQSSKKLKSSKKRLQKVGLKKRPEKAIIIHRSFPVSRITLSFEYEKKKKSREKILFEAAASR